MFHSKNVKKLLLCRVPGQNMQSRSTVPNLCLHRISWLIHMTAPVHRSSQIQKYSAINGFPWLLIGSAKNISSILVWQLPLYLHLIDKRTLHLFFPYTAFGAFIICCRWIHGQISGDRSANECRRKTWIASCWQDIYQADRQEHGQTALSLIHIWRCRRRG